jgi:hypothetical protein
LGSAFLAALVIGSGIAAQTLSPNDLGLQLFENAATTAAGLYTIILMFGPVSGGHFNPVVSLADATFGGLRWRDALTYPAQLLTQELAEQADVVVTMGCGDACPYIPGKRYIDWNLPDPKQRPLQEVRATRDDIQRRVTTLAAETQCPSRLSLAHDSIPLHPPPRSGRSSANTGVR